MNLKEFFQSRRGSALTASLLLGVALILALFLGLASEIREKETRNFDTTILLSMREKGDTSDPIGSPRVEEIARDLTALGGFTILTIVSLVSFGVALFSGKRKLGGIALVAVVLGVGLTSFLKSNYDRPRPELVEHGVKVYNQSFPSGHSMMAAIVYLTLAILLARTQKRIAVRIFIVAVAILLTVLVGVSRVYLGVHWPTDVLGGWAVGASWAILFWLVAMKIDPRLSTEKIP